MFRDLLLLFARRADTILAQCQMIGLMDLPAAATIDIAERTAPKAAEPVAAVEVFEELKRAA